MKSKRTLGVIVILIMMVNFTIMTVRAQDNQTVNIANTQDDGFVTEAGIGIDSSLLHIIDPLMDIRAWLVFENIDINFWEPVTNATLRLTSASTLPFDNDSSVTVYGMKENLGAFGADTTLSPGQVVSMPLTSAFTNVNTSQFYGGAVLDVNVSEIVRELRSHPSWSGDGIAGTETGGDMGFIILGAPDDTRYFYDYLGDPARSADLIIHWNHAPPPPSGGGTFNETYRDLNIWELDHLGTNRTGSGYDLDWNLLNVTDLTEIDSGASITVTNDTRVSMTSYVAQEWGCLYNDTGAANIDTFFHRFALNITGVTNTQAFNDFIPIGVGVSTATPVGGGGLAIGNVGDWAGLIMVVMVDDIRWRMTMYERQGALNWQGQSGAIFNETENEIMYVEFRINVTGAGDWMSYDVYSDPGFTNLLSHGERVLGFAAGPFRYGQTVGSLAVGTSRINTGIYHSYLDMPVADNSTWIVTFQNGTQIGNSTTYDGAIVIADTFLGADPEDPNPPSQGWPDEGPLTRFQTRLFIWFMGFIMIFGPLGYFGYQRPSGYEFVIGLFIMLIGLGFLIAAGSV